MQFILKYQSAARVSESNSSCQCKPPHCRSSGLVYITGSFPPSLYQTWSLDLVLMFSFCHFPSPASDSKWTFCSGYSHGVVCYLLSCLGEWPVLCSLLTSCMWYLLLFLELTPVYSLYSSSCDMMDIFILTSIRSNWLFTYRLPSSSRFWSGYFFKLVLIFCSLKAIVLNKYYYCWYWKVHNLINYSDFNWVLQS